MQNSIGQFKDIYTDIGSLSDLKKLSYSNSEQALRKVAGQFEGVFLNMMLKSMRDASFGDPLFDSQSIDLYQDMMDKQLSTDLAASHGLGIADMIVEQMKRFLPENTNTESINSDPLKLPERGLFNATGLHQNNTGNIESSEVEFKGTPAQFVSRMLPHANQAAEKMGVDAKLLIAQSALETGWGQRISKSADGESSRNLFGIKAGADWQGKTVNITTLEYHDGVAKKEKACFRAYDSYADSFQDYVQFISQRPRYADALKKSASPDIYINELQQAGYATDPQYADKILQIYRQSLNDKIEITTSSRRGN